MILEMLILPVLLAFLIFMAITGCHRDPSGHVSRRHQYNGSVLTQESEGGTRIVCLESFKNKFTAGEARDSLRKNGIAGHVVCDSKIEIQPGIEEDEIYYGVFKLMVCEKDCRKAYGILFEKSRETSISYFRGAAAAAR